MSLRILCAPLLVASISLASQTSPAPAPAPKMAPHKPAAPSTVPAAAPKPQPSPTVAPEPTAVFTTTAGKLTCKLFPVQAPKTVENFVGLATGKKDWTDPKTQQKKHGVPMYDGTIFHRVIPNFMIQGGDPLSKHASGVSTEAHLGIGGPGYSFNDEISPELRFDKPGVMAMANSGPNTNGSQFFITEAAYPSLNDHYSIFGQCDNASVEVVKQITHMPRDASDRPTQEVSITHLAITGMGPAKPVRKTGTSSGTTRKPSASKPKASTSEAPKK